MYFDENNNYYDIVIDNKYDVDNFKNNNINIGNIVFNRHNGSIINPVEGFNRGNMFNNLYNEYKKHSYNLKVNNKKDELLYKIQIYNFAIRDLSLYLDLHSDDREKVKLFIQYNNELNELKKSFNGLYSPLCINEVNNENKWTWIDNPWPWDKGGNI